MNTIYIAVFIVILAILGFNIFNYLSKATELTAHGGKRLGKGLFEGGELVGSTAIGAVRGGVKGSIEGGVLGARSALHRELDISPDEKIEKARNSIRLSSPLPNRDEIKQRKHPALKNTKIRENERSGYCLIGTDDHNGQPRRACVRVGVNDKCSSNQIYPSMAVCVNPSLRA